MLGGAGELLLDAVAGPERHRDELAHEYTVHMPFGSYVRERREAT